MRQVKGFTIVELIIGIAILGILVALAAPSFTESIARRRLDGIANELSTDLQFTRAEAISKNTALTLVASATGYTVGSVKTVTIDSSCSLSSGETLPLSVTFEPTRGMSTAANLVFIGVACSPQTTSTLRVNISTMGVINICSPNGFGGYPSC
ncbi:GspH/FimT family pseudopilin [Rhodoferax sp. U2-2l]|uniref:GspH/FimT family pseudopilin n=1 Tax=Rhodoferax sp. U2-2l TaxID=2884000 RepID=UPI001D0BC6C0|nr:GspH/FimT family pseudopilin [Rhodoferax sp. U2-2l]MCB8745437.1 GspH/FimT family pseudopilin [Rhodoferax sp. U2-2l]